MLTTCCFCVCVFLVVFSRLVVHGFIRGRHTWLDLLPFDFNICNLMPSSSAGSDGCLFTQEITTFRLNMHVIYKASITPIIMWVWLWVWLVLPPLSCIQPCTSHHFICYLCYAHMLSTMDLGSGLHLSSADFWQM